MPSGSAKWGSCGMQKTRDIPSVPTFSSRGWGKSRGTSDQDDYVRYCDREMGNSPSTLNKREDPLRTSKNDRDMRESQKNDHKFVCDLIFVASIRSGFLVWWARKGWGNKCADFHVFRTLLTA